MRTRLNTLFVAIALGLSACESIRDSYDPCGVWLEFAFDHNMEYADSFDPQVQHLDVLVFDAAGNLTQTRHADIDQLTDRKRMFLDRLPFGKYSILTLGNFTPEHFELSKTTLEQTTIALKTASASREFGHLFFGLPVQVDYKADLNVYRIPLIRQTNRFNIVLQTTATDVPEGTAEGPVAAAHTVRIVAPEAGAYDRLNNPTDPTALLYNPHSLLSRIELTGHGMQQLTAAKINTMRLLENQWDGYRIVVREIAGGAEIWSNDLLELLAATKPNKRPDGTELPRAEYFDREGDWNIVIVYRHADTPQTPPQTPDKAFVVLRILINGWIVWQQGIDL